MGRGRTRQLLVARFDGEATSRSPDEVVVEEPLEVRLDGHRVTTTMRTPGHDFELAVGFCHGEGLLAGAPLQAVRYCGTPVVDGPGALPRRSTALETAYNVVTVDTGGRAPVPEARLTTTTSSCGWCGSTAIDDLLGRLPPRRTPSPFPLELLASGPERLAGDQDVFRATGGVHAAGALGLDGTMRVVREDIGRHNAVDKVVGRLLLDGRLPGAGSSAEDELALVVSGRTSFEIVQKAWAAGFAAVVGVSAASSLAVDAAVAAGITLAGFARGGSLNVYVPT